MKCMFWAFVQWTLAQQRGQVIIHSLSATDNLTYTEKTWFSFWTSLLLVGQVVFFFFIYEKRSANKLLSIASFICSTEFYSFLYSFQSKKHKKLDFLTFLFFRIKYFTTYEDKSATLSFYLLFYLMKFEKNLIDDCATHFLALGQKQTTVFSLKSHLVLFWRFCRTKKVVLIEEITTQNIYEYL